MANPFTILEDPRTQNITLTVEGADLRVMSRRKLPDDVRNQIRENKAALLEAMTDEAAAARSLGRHFGLPATECDTPGDRSKSPSTVRSRDGAGTREPNCPILPSRMRMFSCDTCGSRESKIRIRGWDRRGSRPPCAADFKMPHALPSQWPQFNGLALALTQEELTNLEA
jgi:hypothetical protein